VSGWNRNPHRLHHARGAPPLAAVRHIICPAPLIPPRLRLFASGSSDRVLRRALRKKLLSMPSSLHIRMASWSSFDTHPRPLVGVNHPSRRQVPRERCRHPAPKTLDLNQLGSMNISCFLISDASPFINDYLYVVMLCAALTPSCCVPVLLCSVSVFVFPILPDPIYLYT
jgi:hypothetical protein